MAEGFEIKVPISIKGGKEGEKVGKQIGQKVAEQLKKTLQSVKIGGKPGAGVGLPGVSKSIQSMTAKLGAIGVAIGAAVGLLTKSSPYLKGILDIFGRAFMIFFRPFGDFLATLLRPMAILMMKMAVAFLKFTRPLTKGARKGAEEAPQIPGVESALIDLPIQIANWALRVGGAIGGLVLEIGKAAFGLGEKIGQWLLDKVIFPAGEFLSAKLISIWNWTKDFPGWLWEQIIKIWNWSNDFGGWLWMQLMTIWNYTMDFGSWLWTKLTSIWEWTFDFGSWLWNKVTNAFANIGGKIGGILGFAQGGTVPGPIGVPQLAVVHGGEKITPAGRSTSTIFRPTFQITGNISQDIDFDAIVRRAGRLTERDLKQRGII